MASSEITGGYGYTYSFVVTPPKELFCHLCDLIARDPQLSVCCGTNFCKQCLEKGRTPAAEQGRCPVCNDTDVALTTFPNKMSDRQIKKLIVLCVNNKEGCGWKDELAKLEDHVATCEVQDVECPLKCGVTVKRQNLDDHIKNNNCPCRQTICKQLHVRRASRDHGSTQGPVSQATTELSQ